jgi:hypothetical protein
MRPAGSAQRRRVPWLSLPDRTFVAGHSPRPAEGWYEAADRADWFDYGCDLFDAGCYFEAHELWEQVWLAARKVGNDDDARFVHGLIRLAAGGVKWLAQMPQSQHSHLEAARRLLLTAPPRRGLTLASLAAAIDAVADRRPPRLAP